MNTTGSKGKPKNRLRQLWAWTGWGLVCGVMGFSLIPLAQPQIDINNLDKLEHWLVYATLMVWFAQLYPRRGWYRIALGFFTMGTVLEVLQGQTGYRTFSYGDMAANVMGVLGGWVLAATGLSSLLTSLEKRLHSKK